MSQKETAVGIDIGGTNTVFGLVDRDGNILAEGKLKTTSYSTFDDFVEALWTRIYYAAGRAGESIKIMGFGIGAPAGNINRGTIEYAAGLPWKGVIPVTEIFNKHIKARIIVTNDANAAAVGEMIYGGAKGMNDFVVITLGTGLGSGIVADGKLIYGHNGFAGEIGHTSVFMGQEGRECGCGKKGCLETYVSATGITRTMMALMAESRNPCSLRSVSVGKLNSKMIYDAARNGDPLALKAFMETGRILGYKLADVVAHTDPEAIFLFGGLSLAGELILEPARKAMEENLLYVYRGKVKLLESQLNNKNAAVLGASSLIWSKNIL